MGILSRFSVEDTCLVEKIYSYFPGRMYYFIIGKQYAGVNYVVIFIFEEGEVARLRFLSKIN